MEGLLDGFGSRLAARFKKAVEREEATRRREEEERQRVLEEGRAARERLLGELAAMGRAIGVVTVALDDGGLTLGFGTRKLLFARDGDGERVRLAWDGMGDGEEHRLYRQAELGHRWVYSRRRRGREDRLPLLDQGIEELLVGVLGLPRPGEGDVPEPGRDL
ncbi:MAG: hypothetical protein H6738_14060 [Alphaproteobacteria bacterium]|nr:hypothetical protein [Alphaproteobacteria bacterium]MCB9697901.1 hypothetical protein [Alphaproteobacteria bacterium]